MISVDDTNYSGNLAPVAATRPERPDIVEEEPGIESEQDDARAEITELREKLDEVSRERDVYRQLCTIAESNELKLHRKLSGYVDSEMTALKKRNEDLERHIESVAQLATE